MPGVRSQDAQRPRPMAWDAYRSQISLPLTDSLELFERVLRRSLANGDEREYISYPPAQPIAGQFENAIFHLALRTTVVGGTPTVKVVFEDSSDGNNWAILITYTEAGPSDGTYRYQAPTPFGGFLRVRLLISGAGGIGLVLCRGVLSVKRSPSRRTHYAHTAVALVPNEFGHVDSRSESINTPHFIVLNTPVDPRPPKFVKKTPVCGEQGLDSLDCQCQGN